MPQRVETTKGFTMHPSVSAQTERQLAARHINFVFEPNLDVNKIRDVEGNQVRFVAHRAPKAAVARYAEQMRAGAVFPAIVVNERYEIIDGNTRWMALQRNRIATIAAYICSDLSALQARSLSVELNQSHGLSMTEDEIRSFVTSAIEDGQVLDTKAYSRITGINASKLSRWVSAKHFELRAVRVGLAPEYFNPLADSVRAALNVAKLKEVFRQVTALAVDARVPATQIKAIVTEANTASSESEALAAVAQARALRSEDIKAIAAGFKSPRRRSAGSALHIGGLLRFDVAELLDVSPEKRAEVFSRMTCLRERLDRALTRARIEWDLVDVRQSSDVAFTCSDDLVQVH
jgi:hypothetical protein